MPHVYIDYTELGIRESRYTDFVLMPKIQTMQRSKTFCLAAFALAVATLSSNGGAVKTIMVSEHGNNSHVCWEGGTSCLTLDFALGGLESDTTIHVYYPHTFSNVTYANVSTYMENIAIIGINNPTIYCSQIGDGIAFSNMNNVAISGISWNGCSHSGPTTAHIIPLVNLTFVNAFTALFFYNVSNLTIERCHFTSNRGLGVALYDVQGTVNIIESEFMENIVAPELRCTEAHPDDTKSNTTCSPHGGGLYIEFTPNGFVSPSDTVSGIGGIVDSHYLIDGCRFEGNYNPAAFTNVALTIAVPGGYWPFGIGGGLSVALRGNSKGNRITIQNCMFLNNNATFGGGISLEVHDNSENNIFSIMNVTATSNVAVLHAAGGLRIAEHSFHSSAYPLNNQFLLNDITFSDNQAHWGGGMALVFTRSNMFTENIPLNQQSGLSFNNCTWTSNTAVYAGAAAFIANLFVNRVDVSVNVSFNDCTFDGNKIPGTYSAGRSQRYGQGVIYTIGIALVFSGHTIINASIGTALVVSAAIVEFDGQVEFTNGQSIQGGAIYLSDISWIRLCRGLNMNFTHNSAFEAGGAIYYVYSPGRAFSITQACFIQYSDDPNLPPSEWDVTITFSDNRGLYGGSAIQVTDPPGCVWPNGESLFDTSKTHPFNFTQNLDRPPVVATPIDNLILLSPVNVTNGHYTMTVMPGEELIIPVNATDFFNSTAVSAMDVKCLNYTMLIHDSFYEDVCAAGGSFNYSGPRVFVVNNSISGIQLGGPINSTELVLGIKTLDIQPIVSYLRVFMTECRYGFYYDEGSRYCHCYDSRYAVGCFDTDDSLKTPCIRTGFWYGKISTNKLGLRHVEGRCSFDKCRTTCQEECQSGSLDGWCKLPDHDYDLCLNHHAGPLCALCRDGFSYNYDGFLCIPNEDCNPLNAVLVVFVIITFWFLLIAGLLIIMKMHLRIGSGYVYCFLYYFSILPYMARNNLGNIYFGILVGFFYSIVGLDPEFLSHIRLCFIKDITAVQLEVFHYLHPLVVTATIYLITFLSRKCSRLFCFSGQSPLHALCILLLLSYNSLFQTSINLLAPVTLQNKFAAGTDTLINVWIQPSTPYFDPTEHLPYALIALLVELVLVIPFTVIVLFAPFLMRWRRMARFKPIWDEYQACYKDKYRWFAGYYLVCRHVIALTAFASPSEILTIFLQQTLNILILLIHAYIQPYRERWLNVLDTVFLLDLVLLSIINGSTAGEVFGGDLYSLHLAVRYTLILIPCLYFILACVTIIGVKIKIWYDSRSKMAANTPARTVSMGPIRTDSEGGSSNPVPIGSREDRPLLETSDLSTNYSPQEHRTDLTPTASPKSVSVLHPFLSKVAAGVSSQVDYWRTISHDTRPRNEDTISFERCS